MFDGKQSKRLFYIILIGWFILNMLQSVFMEIHEDEAYYALWGQHLAWGYYDHPPMVALMTYISSFLFPGTLGVRFMTVVCQALSLFFIWKILDIKSASKKEVYLFFIITASFVMFEAYGFLTTPDPFLLFFTASFLLSYKRFLANENWGNALLLAVTMAGLVYSKYMGALVIIFTIISNPRLVLKPKAWVAVVVAVALFTPHILWQVQNDFIGMKYQVLERNGGFKWGNIGDYLGNQLLVFNPLTLGLFFFVLFRRKCGDIFDKGCRFIAAGILLFFLVMIYKDRAEPHWTVAATIPMMIILIRSALTDEIIRKYVRKWILPTLALFVIARILLLTPALSGIGFSGKKIKYSQMEAKMSGEQQMSGMDSNILPVVFRGSFQDASLYRFFSHNETTSLSSIRHIRHTQFDIWKFEETYLGKDVWLADSPETFRLVHNFQDINRLEITFSIAEPTQATSSLQATGETVIPQAKTFHDFLPGDTLDITYRLTNPTSYDVLLAHPELPVKLMCVYEHQWKYALSEVLSSQLPSTLRAGTIHSGTFSTVIPIDLPFRKGGFGLCLDNTFVTPLLSGLTSFTIKEEAR